MRTTLSRWAHTTCRVVKVLGVFVVLLVHPDGMARK